MQGYDTCSSCQKSYLSFVHDQLFSFWYWLNFHLNSPAFERFLNLLTHWYCRYCSPDRGINGICAAWNILSRRWRGWGRNWNFVCSDKYDYNGFTFKPLSVDITIHKIILIVMIVDGQYRWPVQRQLECHVAGEQTQRNWNPPLATTHNITGLAIFFWLCIVLFQLCHQICRSFLDSSFFPGSTRPCSEDKF